MLILFSHEINNTKEGIWNKTIQLSKLIALGYRVPDFIAIPTGVIASITEKKIHIETLATAIRKIFPQTSYAVRSSCLSEDGASNSMAGQFHTELSVMPKNLEEAIIQVIEQAQQTGIHESQISIIVQKYIHADYSGVCFTRNPVAGSEMAFEYHKGIGEDLVGGKIIPEKIAYYQGEKWKICWFNIQPFCDIETSLWHPQDIEWCIENGTLYFLQTRPITTISSCEYEMILTQEKYIPKTGDYFFEKNEISEIAPRPTPFTFSLLEKIYWENGPIERVYQKYSIHYIPNSFLKIIGNELYIDRELELQSLLPAMSILNKRYIPKLVTIRWFWKTLRNLFRVSLLREDINMIERLEQSLLKNENETTLDAALESFLKDYEIIFEVNIFAAKWLKKMELFLKNEKVSLWEILQSDPDTFSEWNKREFKITTLEILQWNTIEIGDITELYNHQEKPITSEPIQTWWNILPEWKRQSYGIHISRGIRYQQYREYARILMLQHINTIRNILIWVYWIENIHTTYFCTVDEILNESIDQDMAIVRENEYLKNNTYNFPNRITARYIQPNITKNTGISPGIVRWTLVDTETIRSIKGPMILKTQILSPNLTKYFDEIVGIISEKWSLLSHLAIIAREKWIPIIISNETWIKLWDIVEINWSNWEIQNISK